MTKAAIKIYWKHTMRYRWQHIFLVLTVLALSVAEIVGPYIKKTVIDLLVSTTPDTDTQANHRMWVYVIFVIGYHIVDRIRVYLVSFCQPLVMRDLLNSSYSYILNHSHGYFLSNHSGALMTRIKRFKASYETLSDRVIMDFMKAIPKMIMIIVVMFLTSQRFGYIVLAWTFVFFSIVYSFNMYRMKYDRLVAVCDSSMTAHISDTMANQASLKIFTRVDSEVDRFSEITQLQYECTRKAWNISNYFDIVRNVFTSGLELSMLILSGHSFMRHEITIGQVVFITGLCANLKDIVSESGRWIKDSNQALAYAEEGAEELTTPHEIVDQPEAKALLVSRGMVEFRDVNFSYDTKNPIFKGFNLTVYGGQHVGIVGPSGAGKSTLGNIILRFKDLPVHSGGSIFIDRQNIHEVSQNSLRQSLGFVTQHTDLLHRSVIENIRMGRPEATDGDVIQASKAAHTHEFILRLPRGYETVVGEKGYTLSGGQRQRIAIARAILKNAPILILDEATSSLDTDVEELITDGLKTLMAGKTSIAIAHRLSTLDLSDRIIVIMNGVVIEDGTPEDLAKITNGHYANLRKKQSKQARFSVA